MTLQYIDMKDHSDIIFRMVLIIKKAPTLRGLAVTTRLELATSGVTGRHSNQLNYVTFFLKELYLPKTGVQI